MSVDFPQSKTSEHCRTIPHETGRNGTDGADSPRKMPGSVTRREFVALSAAAGSISLLPRMLSGAVNSPKSQMNLGLVTYQWGRDWDLPTLIDHCEQAEVHGVELRTQHEHGVEPSLSKSRRRQVRQRFADSPVELVGYGSNAQFHEPDPKKVQQNIELTKAYIKLMHDCGGSGVKVKPNGLPKNVPPEKTLRQIGRALNVVAAFGADYGQEIRLEVHGRGTSELPNIKRIMDVADHPNVGVCWNCNGTDLEGDGLESNFKLVQNRLADTVHVRELNVGNYPYAKLMTLLAKMHYAGWILLECRTNPSDRIAGLKEQKAVFEKLVAEAG
ncbi:MAG: sugar phosphate isomerase/epimerase family protein [Planctomycetota bacterium]